MNHLMIKMKKKKTLEKIVSDIEINKFSFNYLFKKIIYLFKRSN